MPSSLESVVVCGEKRLWYGVYSYGLARMWQKIPHLLCINLTSQLLLVLRSLTQGFRLMNNALIDAHCLTKVGLESSASLSYLSA